MHKGCHYDEPAESLSKAGQGCVLGSTLKTLSGDNLELLKHPRVFAFVDTFWINNLKTFALRNLETYYRKHGISDIFRCYIQEVYGNTIQGDSAIRKILVETVKDPLGK